MTSISDLGPKCLPRVVEKLDYPSAVHLGKTCRALHTSVNAAITVEAVDEVADKILGAPNFSLQTAPLSCTKAKRFIECVLRKNGLEFQFVDPALQTDKSLIKTALASVKILHPDHPEFIDQVLSKMPQEPQAELREFVQSVECGTKEWLRAGLRQLFTIQKFHGDREIALAALKHDGGDLDYYCGVFFKLSPELMNDKEFIHAVLEGTSRFELRPSECCLTQEEIVEAKQEYREFVSK